MYKNTNNANYQDATTSPTIVQVLTEPKCSATGEQSILVQLYNGVLCRFWTCNTVTCSLEICSTRRKYNNQEAMESEELF